MEEDLTPPGFPHPFTLALDDSDTPWGGCTTHMAALLLERLDGRILLEDYPLLVRLFPGVPRKTRGNAAVVVRGYSRDPPEALLEEALSWARDYSANSPPGKEPGAALHPSTTPWRVPRLRLLYKRALREYVERREALSTARASGTLAAGGSGLTGAVASLAALAPWDHYTFELIAYRDGGERRLHGDPRAEATIPACAWANYELDPPRPAAAPGGPDPVLAGFRGAEAWCLSGYEPLLRTRPSLWAVYRSNQHTGGHTAHWRPLPYRGARVRLRIGDPPRVLAGGHVVLQANSEIGVDIAFYRETGPLGRAARMLQPGDMVLVEGVVVPRSHGPTLAAERIIVDRVTQRWRLLAPRCPRCGSRMKSMGREKGYKCPRCGFRDPAARPVRVWTPRRLLPGTIVPGVSGARHLTVFPWWRPGRGPRRGVFSVGCFVSRSGLPGAVLGEC